MKKSSFLVVLSLALISTIFGAIFLMHSAPSEEVRSYLNEFMWNMKSGVSDTNIFVNALKDNLLTLSAIFICGFFKPGFIVTIFVTMRKCFVSAFTVSAFMYYYSLKGFLTAAVIALPFMILFTSLIIISAASITLSLDNNRLTLLKPYILFTLICTITFFAAALSEGYIVPSLTLLILK